MKLSNLGFNSDCYPSFLDRKLLRTYVRLTDKMVDSRISRNAQLRSNTSSNQLKHFPESSRKKERKIIHSSLALALIHFVQIIIISNLRICNARLSRILNLSREVTLSTYDTTISAKQVSFR